MTLKYDVKDLRSRGVVKLKDKDMFSVWVRTACCNMTSAQLRGLADITQKFARGFPILFRLRLGMCFLRRVTAWILPD